MSSIDIYPLIYMYTPLRSPNHPGEICMAPGSAVAMPAVCILCEKPCDEAPGRLGYVAASEQDAHRSSLCATGARAIGTIASLSRRSPPRWTPTQRPSNNPKQLRQPERVGPPRTRAGGPRRVGGSGRQPARAS